MLGHAEQKVCPTSARGLMTQDQDLLDSFRVGQADQILVEAQPVINDGPKPHTHWEGFWQASLVILQGRPPDLNPSSR